MAPEANPMEPLYIETWLLDVETMMDARRLNMISKLNRNNWWADDSYPSQLRMWTDEKTKGNNGKYRIEPEDVTGTKE